MSIEDAEKKLKELVETPKTLESTAKDAVIGANPQQDRWKTMEQAHYLEQDESATDLFLKPEERGLGANKLVIEDNASNDWNKDKLAWDLRNPGSIIKEAKKSVEDFAHPHASKPLDWVDAMAAKESLHHLPRLSAFSARNGNIGPDLITAIIANEQHYYTMGKDSLPDAVISQVGWFPGNPTVGPAQIKLDYIKKLTETYPSLLGSPEDAVKKAADKSFSTKLTAAYLEERIKKFEQWAKHPPSEPWLDFNDKLLLKYAYPLWKSGKQVDAAIMSYNPGAGHDHLNNVKHRLSELNRS